ncbi:MAG TPA: class I SAM-dependent methyltransferase [Saprospiraceae bacterium]|nr:class I SAM-dependent methyltransferase [Saprospiraceae bacterium]
MQTLTEHLTLEEIKNELEQILKLPEFGEPIFEKLNVLFCHLEYLKESKQLSTEDITKIRDVFDDKFYRNTLQGYGFKKPYGYAGDFMIIDKYHCKFKSEIQPYKSWDLYMHRQAAPKAVRNRKDYLKKIILYKLTTGSIDLLNIASGPCRDLCELYDVLDNPSMLNTTCVDIDGNAIMYARQVTKLYEPYINFIEQNVLKLKLDMTYDVVWSAGLFDYFSDRVFVFMLKRMLSWCNVDGEIIIGNFNEQYNPSRLFMEVFGDWHLIHRSTEQLVQLAIEAGCSPEMIKVKSEEEGVNLFLHIKKSNR